MAGKPVVAVLGWYGHGNVGDEAYRLAFPNLFPQFDLKFTDDLQTVAPFDGIILGGGNVLLPYFLNQLNRFSKIPAHAVSVNITTKEQASAMSKFRSVYSRNSLRLFSMPSGTYVQTIPDIACVLKGDRVRGKSLIREIYQSQRVDLYERVVAVVINTFLCFGDDQLHRDHTTFDKVCNELGEIFDRTNSSFIFVPMGIGLPFDDRIANSQAYSRCKYWKKNALVFDKLSVTDCLDIFSAVDATVSTRLHSGIFSANHSTPFIDLTHHDKTKFFLETINCQSWGVNYWHFDFDRCYSLLQKFLFGDQCGNRLHLYEAYERNSLLLNKLRKEFKLA